MKMIRQAVEVTPEMRYIPQKLSMVRLSVFVEAEQFFDEGNHFLSRLLRMPFSEMVKMASDASLAIGDPFWKACSTRNNKYYSLSTNFHVPAGVFQSNQYRMKEQR